ncbi:hypothetical protein A4A49_52572 [Nicotiana attenuata]|uniref:Uncharacterized protein n=1 Tax=Nicotiana attenuata TaxID=49451 RepID=A0A1J6LAX0_NICAT|nr:hypothetical protein A4A49_52572 [Nicotiana attenuata]
MEVAKDLWTSIKEHFLNTNGPRMQQLKAELAECKQKGITICTCDLGAILEKKREEEKHVMMMARGIDKRGDVMAFAVQGTSIYRGRNEAKVASSLLDIQNGGETDLVVMVNQVDAATDLALRIAQMLHRTREMASP